MKAVRIVYASTMSREGLEYRRHRGLLEQDEQMALLVQRVSGEMHGRYYFPQVAGVGFSFNPFVWHEDIDPKAGVLRLVFGLGTRAVDRTEDDYARMVALNAPMKRPETREEDIKQYSQRRVDTLDLKANQFATRHFESVARCLPPPTLEFFAACDEELLARMRSRNMPDSFPWMLTLDRLLSETDFPKDMHQLLRILDDAYETPVDIEFTTNFLPDGRYRINLLQCRPFQVKVKVEGKRVKYPESIPNSRVIVRTTGPVVGHSLAMRINRLIHVLPSVYGRMSLTQRYSVARAIGRLTHLDGPNKADSIMLVGPGRWGTLHALPGRARPSLPRSTTVSVLCELALMHEGLIPRHLPGNPFLQRPGGNGHALFCGGTREGGARVQRRAHPAPPQPAPGTASPAPSNGPRPSGSSTPSPAGPGPRHFLNVDSMRQRAVCYQEG